MKKVAGLTGSSPRIAGVLALTLLSAMAACGGDDGGGGDTPDAEPPYNGPVLKRASKSSTIAITGDDKYVAMVNPEKGTVSVFDTATDTRLAEVKVGGEPSSIVIAPDDTTAFVANRADATVVKITNLTTATPTVSQPLEVGSEPTAVALVPTGRTLFVAEFAEGRVIAVDTGSMAIVKVIDAPANPKALAVTNDGDQEDADETLVVPEFFGEANGKGEATDDGRTGRVRLYDAGGGFEAQAAITFAPHLTGFQAESPPGTPIGNETTASPNQLASAIVIGTKIYVTSVSASPQGPTFFKTNVQPIVYVGDLANHKEDTGNIGTMNLAKLVKEQVPDDANRLFLADLIDIAFVKTDVMYTISKGADAIQRVVLDPTKGPQLGSDFNKQIDLGVAAAGGTKKACQNPTGLVIAHASARAFVNCWVTRQLGDVDLSKQVLAKTAESSTIDGSEAAAQAGRRFYFTGRARWSNHAWSSCGSCHPDGLSDSITWKFGTGPRQTTSMDGSFSHGKGTQVQRAFNWTAVNDELHDFERNTRGVSGGLGALTVPIDGTKKCVKDGGALTDEKRIDIGTDGLVKSVIRAPSDAEPTPPTANSALKEIQDTTAGACTTDWDKIEAFVKTIRPPRALRTLDPASVARGAAIFAEPGTPGADPNAAGCVECHGGEGWTTSRIFYKATSAKGDLVKNDDIVTLIGANFTPPAGFPKVGTAGIKAWNFAAKFVSKQPTSTLFDGAESNTELGGNQNQCAIRNVGTFGDATLETRDSGLRAQGRLGYNVPSLYGLSVGAPYLHHGQAATLEDLFKNEAFLQHAEAGSQVWLRQGADTVEARKKDLIAFLRSIDASTSVQAVPTGFEACVK